MIIHVVNFIFIHLKNEHGITLRLQIEFNWIQRLRTMLPMGLNTKDRAPLDTKCRNWRDYMESGRVTSNDLPT